MRLHDASLVVEASWRHAQCQTFSDGLRSGARKGSSMHRCADLDTFIFACPSMVGHHEAIESSVPYTYLGGNKRTAKILLDEDSFAKLSLKLVGQSIDTR